jgi:hypothetical protein
VAVRDVLLMYAGVLLAVVLAAWVETVVERYRS